jgi:hypothetical protein
MARIMASAGNGLLTAERAEHAEFLRSTDWLPVTDFYNGSTSCLYRSRLLLRIHGLFYGLEWVVASTCPSIDLLRAVRRGLPRQVADQRRTGGGALPRQVPEHRRTGGGSGAGRREMSPNTVPRRVLGRMTTPGAVGLTPTLRGLVVGANPTASSDVNVAPCLKNPTLGNFHVKPFCSTSFAIFLWPLRLILFQPAAIRSLIRRVEDSRSGNAPVAVTH